MDPDPLVIAIAAIAAVAVVFVLPLLGWVMGKAFDRWSR